jgi:ribosomal protein S18 acetylase RimI-like enzyme
MRHFAVYDARPADAAALAEFAARTFFESFAADNDPENMRLHLAAAFSPQLQRAELENPDIDTLVLVDGGGRWMAFAQLRAGKTSDGVPATGSVELWRFYVDAPWHGHGLAAELMAAAKQRARARGAATLWLGVWQRNARAQAFYRKHGFNKVGNHVFVVGNDPQTDDILLCDLK